MPTLKEIKGRIASVQSTLKITSAMKLVSSAKLRKAQAAIEAMRPYQERLSAMLELAHGGVQNTAAGTNQGDLVSGQTVVIAMASNSSLCGGFNAQVIAKAKEVLRECPGAQVIAIGRKMSDALRKAGAPVYTTSAPSALSDHPSYAPVSAITDTLMADSSVGRVLLVYNHFVSTGKQVPVVETLFVATDGKEAVFPAPDVILEPSRRELMEALYPKSVKIRFFAALLDSAAAEHAARTVAMQAATDNGEDLLQELTLQYNKGRQQKITNEILDLAGGSQTQ